MTPPVRGRRKALVAALLASSATTTGALVGFAAGVLVTAALAVLPFLRGGPGAVAVAVVAGAAACADLAATRTGRLRPLSVRRQVPREWSRLFAPPTVAVLYGGRLGVGPLTILPTWLWWAAFLLGAWAGPAWSAAAGAAFGLTRTLVMVGLAEWIAPAAARRMARLRSAEAAARILGVVGAVALAALTLTFG